MGMQSLAANRIISGKFKGSIMFYVTPEGSKKRAGINFFPWSERAHSVGFLLHLFGKTRFYFRWSVRRRRLIVNLH